MKSFFKLIIICLFVSLVASLFITFIDYDNSESEIIYEDAISWEELVWTKNY